MRRISVLSPQWRITVPFLVPAIFKTEYAPVMELVDMRDLGSRAAMRVGSSPFRRTIERISEPYIVWGKIFVQTKRHPLP